MTFTLKRRDFLLVSAGSGALFSPALAGCGDGENTGLDATSGGSSAGSQAYGSGGTPYGGGGSPYGSGGSAGGTSNSAGAPTTAGGQGGQGGEGGAVPTCGRVTAPNIEGPFFKPSSPERSDLRVAGTAGVLLEVSGTVYAADCSPLAGAILDFWQADETGAYDNVGTTYRGHQTTDQDGRYRLLTIVPGRYLNGATYRPAHIHVKAAGTGTMLLTTQLYFPGDPYNEGDPFIEPSLIMSVSEDASGLMLASFDFVLPAA